MNKLNDSLSQYLIAEDPISLSFRKAATFQTTQLKTITNKCNLLEDSIAYMTQTLTQLQSRIKLHLHHEKDSKISQLREQQKMFIIGQLQLKVKRLEESEENAHNVIMQKESLVFELQLKNEELVHENNQLRQEVHVKTKKLKQLSKINSFQKFSHTSQLEQQQKQDQEIFNIKKASQKKEQKEIENEYYSELQQKLRQMQDCLNGQIEMHKKKNIKLSQEVEGLKGELRKEAANGKRIYQMELKVKTLMAENKQLEEGYTQQLANSNQSEVKFARKISELKGQILEAKKATKNLGREFEKQLRKFSAVVLGANEKPNLFLGTTSISEQFNQLAKQIAKCNRKQSNAIALEKDGIIEDLQQALQVNERKFKQQQQNLQKLKNQKPIQKSVQKSSSANGPATTNRSNNSRSESQKTQTNKNEVVLQLKQQLEFKQKQVEQSRKKHDTEQTRLTTHILQLQQQLAELQMQIKYKDQKHQQLKLNLQENQKNFKIDRDREFAMLSQKVKEIEKQRDQMRAKFREGQEKIFAKDKAVREVERKLKESAEKIKKYEKKVEVKSNEYKKSMENKEAMINELLSKNQTLSMELKLTKQRQKIQELTASTHPHNQQLQTPILTPSLKQQKQLIAQKQQLFAQLKSKEQEVNDLKEILEERDIAIGGLQLKVNQIVMQAHKQDNENKMLHKENEGLKQSAKKIKNEKIDQGVSNFSILKQEYEKREKLLKEDNEKIVAESQLLKKQLENKIQKISNEFSQFKKENYKNMQHVSRMDQERLKFEAEKFKDSQKQRKLVRGYQQQIQTLSMKISQLSQNSLPLPSKLQKKQSKKFKMTDSTEYISTQCQTQKIQTTNQSMNTVDLFALETQQHKNSTNLFLNQLDKSNSNQKSEQNIRNSNLFPGLNGPTGGGDSDVFEICDQNEEINFGQSSTNLQIRQIFSGLRIQIEKLFNEQQNSVTMVKLLPPNLQDDFYQMMTYIKEKIGQIKQHNEITFIVAQPGAQISELENSLIFPQLLHRSSEGQQLRRALEQKEATINSLLHEKTSQQNTVD